MDPTSTSKSLYPRFPPSTLNAKHFRNTTLSRLDNFEGGSHYSSLNLSSILFEARTDSPEHVSLQVWSPGHDSDGSGEFAKPTFEQAVRAKGYRKFVKGERLGPSWSNHWVRAEINVPQEWRGKERVQLEFDPGCEAMIWTTEGLPLQGITGGYGGDRRVEFLLDEKARAHPLKLYIEVSCNAMFGNGDGGDMSDRYFTLASADIVVPRMPAWHLMWDFRILKDIARSLPENSPLANKAMYVANEIMNTFKADDLETVATCRKLAEKVLGVGWQEKGAGIYDSKGKEEDEDVQCWGIGHCHIDTAWLWRFTQTKQKIARSWSTQVDLMNRYPEHRFSCSQAQQFKWLEQLYPQLFDKVKAKVGEGSFQPIGGTWVEMDTNMPSGEALCRQFTFGQRYFKSRFGRYCETFWLPDTFGYSSQLPQLSRLAGMRFFFTQKLSWSQFNNFPNTTFNWVGLDGSQVLTHMTPVDTYTAQATVGDVRKAVVAHKNLEQTDKGLLVFGNGDGGGGPLAPMLEGLRRIRAAADQGRDLPKVVMGHSVDDFFKKVEKETQGGKTLVGWRGELYLELHRGTYTSHGSIKRHNRKSEILLREIEHAATFASLHANQLKSQRKGGDDYVYPKDAIDKLWEDVLLCQFHDVLPGSAIGLVYKDAEKIYAHVASAGQKLLDEAISYLHPQSLSIASPPQSGCEVFALNTICQPREEVVQIRLPAQFQEGERARVQVSQDDPSVGYVLLQDREGRGTAGMVELEAVQRKVSVERVGDAFKVMNSSLAIVISGEGRITSLYDVEAGREIIAQGKSAGFIVYEDWPLNYDAWDVDVFHLETGQPITASQVTVLETGPLRATLLAEYTLGKSTIRTKISLDSTPATGKTDALSLLRFDTKVDWHERHRFLKFEAPVDVHSETAIYETQFGTISRPTHRNTTWDAAKFEVCGHKFADLSEFGYGVALLNESKYGYAVEGNVMRLSLLRGATSPDENQDQGKHKFSFALLPHRGHFIQSDVVLAARFFNQPLIARFGQPSVRTLGVATRLLVAGSTSTTSYNAVNNVVLDTIKRGDDDYFLPGPGSGSRGASVVARIYEAYGGKGKVELETSWPIRRAVLVDLLEREIEPVEVTKVDGTTSKIALNLRGFEVLTLKVYTDGPSESSTFAAAQSVFKQEDIPSASTSAAATAKAGYAPSYDLSDASSADESWEDVKGK